jgi:hypothetical protein
MNLLFTNNICFYKLKDIGFAFDALKKTFVPQFEEIGTYFETNYIGCRRDGARTRDPPRFYPHKIWNLHDRVKADEPRTQDHQEAWHGAFSKCCKTHGSSNELVKKLREEQHRTEKIVSDINKGTVNPRRKNNVDKDADLRKAVNSYDKKNILTFLTKVASICKSKKQNK